MMQFTNVPNVRLIDWVKFWHSSEHKNRPLYSSSIQSFILVLTK